MAAVYGGDNKGDLAIDKGWESRSTRQCRRTSRPRNSMKRLSGRQMVDETNTEQHGAPPATAALPLLPLRPRF